MAHDVFVSYSSKDKPTADAVCAKLEAEGIRCWVAPRDITPGKEWGAAIIDAIKGARVMVLIFSAHANGSPQINREVERAVNRGLPVIPFRIEDVTPTASLEYFISTPHWLDAFNPPLENHLHHLAQVIRQLLDISPGVDPVPRPAKTVVPHKHSRARELKIALACCLLALLVFAGWWFGIEQPQRRAADERIRQEQQARVAAEQEQQKQLAEAKARADEAERQRKAAEEKAQQEEQARLAQEQQRQLADAKARADEAERQQKAAEDKAREQEAARVALEQQKQEAERLQQVKISDDLKYAQTALQAGRFADARQQFQAVLALDDANASARSGLADVDKAEQAAAAALQAAQAAQVAQAAALAASNSLPAKKFAGTWKGTVDYKNLDGGLLACTIVVNNDETSVTETLDRTMKRPIKVDGDTISWKPGFFHEETFTMTITQDRKSAHVTLSTAWGTGYGNLARQ